MQVVAPWQRGISAAPVGHHNPRHYWAHTGAMPCMVVRRRMEGGPPPPVWISSSKSTTQSPSVAVWPARTFISRWCDGRVGSLPGHPHTLHISPHPRPPPRSIIENSPRWMRVMRQTGVRNNIHHLSQHLSLPVSLILSPPWFLKPNKLGKILWLCPSLVVLFTHERWLVRRSGEAGQSHHQPLLLLLKVFVMG